MVLLSIEQASSIPSAGVPVETTLSTGQRVMTLRFDPQGSPRSTDDLEDLKYGRQRIRFETDHFEPNHFQLTPSSRFPKDLPHGYEYACLFRDSSHAPKSEYALLRHPSEQGYCISVKVRLTQSEDLDPQMVAVDDTIAQAIGVRRGEIIDVAPLHKPRPLRERVALHVFKTRHVICRVIGAVARDQEKPVARLSESTMDLLGIKPGGHIVMMTRPSRTRGYSSVSARAFPRRGDALDRNDLSPDFYDILGCTDLPKISIDLEMRLQLGVKHGDAVYVRPSTIRFIGAALYIPIAAAALMLSRHVTVQDGAVVGWGTFVVMLAIYAVALAIFTLARLR